MDKVVVQKERGANPQSPYLIILSLIITKVVTVLYQQHSFLST